MTETGTSVQEAPQNVDSAQQHATDNKALLDQMMNFNLNGVLPPEVAAVVENNQAAPPAEGDVPREVEAPAAVPSFDIFKEKFGYESPEAAIKEIEELRVLKANPTPAEIKFENERSKQIFEALQAGKHSEVYAALKQQQELDAFTSAEINKDNAGDIIKMGMQLKYADLSPAEINYKYNKEYGIPKEPVIGDSELDEDFQERHSAWKEKVADIEMNRVIEAKLAKPELEAAKTKIVLPSVENKVDEGYLQYLKELEQQPALNAQIKEAYSKLTPKALETKIKFIDEPNKIDFEFQHEPDADALKNTIDIVSDFDKLVASFIKSDGTPDREGFAKAMYFAMNADKVILEAIKQSKNATIKSFLPDNSGGGTQRQFPQSQEPGELDKMMEAAGIRRAS